MFLNSSELIIIATRSAFFVASVTELDIDKLFIFLVFLFLRSVIIEDFSTRGS